MVDSSWFWDRLIALDLLAVYLAVGSVILTLLLLLTASELVTQYIGVRVYREDGRKYAWSLFFFLVGGALVDTSAKPGEAYLIRVVDYMRCPYVRGQRWAVVFGLPTFMRRWFKQRLVERRFAHAEDEQ